MGANKTYFTRLEEILADQGRKKSWLAERLDVDRSTVTRWVKGDTRPTRRRRQIIADLLGLSVCDLFYQGERQSPEAIEKATDSATAMARVKA